MTLFSFLKHKMNRNFNDLNRDKYRQRDYDKDRMRRDRNSSQISWDQHQEIKSQREYEQRDLRDPRGYPLHDQRDYQRDPRDMRQRDFIPQHQQIYQPLVPEKQEICVRSLIEAKGRLGELVLLSGQRKALLQLYSGMPHENWFLTELVDALPILVKRRAGASFVYSINHKVRESFLTWHLALIRNAAELLEFPLSALIFCDMIPLIDLSNIKGLAKYCWSIYQLKYEEQYMTLYVKLIQVFKDDEEIIKPLLDVDWSELKNQQEMVITLISEIPSKTDRLYSKYSGKIAGMTQAVDFVHTICAFLEYGSAGVRDQIFVSMTSSVYDLAMRDPSWNVLSMMITVGTDEQRKKIGETFRRIIESNPSLPPHFDILLTRFLLSLQVPDRMKYIASLLPSIDKLRKPKFVELIKYMKCLLSEQ